MPEPDFKERARLNRQEIMAGAQRRLDAHQGGRAIVKYISREVDALLIDLWRDIAGPVCDQVDLVGVGGYGRSELCPHSDWDLLFLVPKSRGAEIDAAIQRFLQVLWDCGAHIGHAVRTPVETRKHAETDHHARTALLESRLISGVGKLWGQVQKSCAQQHWSKRQRVAFCKLKLEECSARRRFIGDTAFLMEPDIKSGKGGLRDVSTIFWLSMAWYGVPTARELIGQGVVDEKEFEDFVRGRDFLWRVRSGLHLLAGREDDRLRFEYQQELASRFRYRDSVKSSAEERFLKNYFLTVRRIADLSDIFLLHFEEQIHPPRRLGRRVDLGGGMEVRKDKISIHDTRAFSAEPLNLIRVFVESQKEHRYLNSRALRTIRKHAGLVNAAVRASKAANDGLLEILRSPRNVATALRQMHETGVLGRLVPDFGRITGHGQFDRYHSYTVDAHTIRAIDILRDFRLGEGRFIDMPLASKLMPELQRPELLYLALLYHDIAKGRGGDHSELGDQLARKFCQRLGLSNDDIELVAWLVLHHLALSKAAQHYDLSDPEVVADFARFVGDRERLVYLFLLTVADVTAVGPDVWTEWKGHLFTQLFHSAEACLRTGRVTPSDKESRLASRRESVLSMCEPGERNEVSNTFAVLSATLTLHFPPALLLDLCRMLKEESGAHLAVNEPLGYTQVLAWGVDRPKLFSHLTATLANANTKALTAHAYALRDGRILDEFHITDAADVPVRDPDQLERLRQRIEAVLAGAEPLPAKRPAEPDVLMRALPVEVRHLEAAAKSITAIEVVAADRRGLLAKLAAAIAETDIDMRGANISTFGEKAVDVFFVTDRRGRKLDQVQTDLLIQRLHDAAELN
ncbi:MAG: [protein-PII] uridylyltransferase [Gammaproteobacteria bacterium]|nr:[protein-PII] uridylyltransferase [Gammaproteobacteria bacterium]